MPLLPTITGPADLRSLAADQLPALAIEIRDFLVSACARNGGHLGPNLGAVELTIALHRVFDSPREPIIFDTGHQSYVHKILTGRQAGFERLKTAGGLSGYPSRKESEHDWVENSHASTALSYADGMAKAFAVRGDGRPVVAVVGDGALTGGMCWEALNNIAAARDRPVIIVVNDNGRSYSPTIGGVADRLASLRLRPGYEDMLEGIKRSLGRTPMVGRALYDALHGMKKGIKDVLAPQGMFEDLGLKYVGAVDGHDIEALESAFGRAREFGAPVIVHCVTIKGFGYAPAQANEEDAWHSTGAFDPDNGMLTSAAGPTWTGVFSAELVRIGAARSDVVAITAAMLYPTGLAAFAQAYPERTFDVGIAEQHAVASAAGMAMAGLHPVVAIYATFLNRGFDQMLLDVALHGLPVTFVLDRAGVTGDDGPSHNGMWDLSILGVVPGMRVAAPRDRLTLRAALREAIAHETGPTAVRFPKGALAADLPALRTVDGSLDVLYETSCEDPGVEVLVVAAGPLAAAAVEAGTSIGRDGWAVRVVSPTWIRPVPEAVLDLASTAELVVTVEDGGLSGGFGSWVAQKMREDFLDRPVLTLGLAQEFLDMGKRGDLLIGAGLDAEGIEYSVRTRMEALHAAMDDGPTQSRPGPAAGNVVDLARNETRGMDPTAESVSS
ncbi:MAG: 1-deoxy-D-xylulose-5-phosphate synthase [Geodermatophilaceae bacterium]|nr:1-deoxy-D-xylulose-5-phosphate synthase [Geodermatophilaceae bacterium]